MASLFEASQADGAGHLFPSGTLHETVCLPFSQQHEIQSTPTPGCFPWVQFYQLSPFNEGTLTQTQLPSDELDIPRKDSEHMQSRFGCVPLFATPWTVAHQAPLSMVFSKQGVPSSRGFSWPWTSFLNWFKWILFNGWVIFHGVFHLLWLLHCR